MSAISDIHVEFTAYQEPRIDAGEYKLTARQTILGDTFQVKTTYALRGERLVLSPDALNSLYPPEGSFGMFSETLPYVSLRKPTFFWDRSPFSDDKGEGYPWLVLLMTDEEDLLNGAVRNPITQTLAELEADTTVIFPPFQREVGEQPDDRVTVLDAKVGWLKQVLPTEEELPLLAHLRRRSDRERPTALMMSNRLPKEGSNTNMHLISIEGRYRKGKKFDFQGAENQQLMRFICLKSWSFSCSEQFKITSVTLQQLSALPSWQTSELQVFLKKAANQALLCASSDELVRYFRAEMGSGLKSDDEAALVAQLQENSRFTQTFEQVVLQLGVGTLQPAVLAKGSEKVRAMFRQGYVPLPHHLRQCDQTYSWYHGPLVPYHQDNLLRTAAFPELPDFADQLTRLLPEHGMLDVTYSAAFQLGRMLAIQEHDLTAVLYQWKFEHDLRQSEQQQQPLIDHLGLDLQGKRSEIDPKDLQDWFAEVALLADVPFNYLIPDPSLLPEEYMGFFALDAHWIACLQYGLFSMGGPLHHHGAVTKASEWQAFEQLCPPVGKRSGFVLRSQLVHDYPDLFVEGYDSEKSKEPLPLLRKATWGPGTLFCLFDGDLSAVELFLKPEGLHFGVDRQTDGTFTKDLNTTIDPGSDPLSIEIPQKGSKDLQRLDWLQIAKNLQQVKKQQTPVTGADLGMELIDGSSKGRFVRKQ